MSIDYIWGTDGFITIGGQSLECKSYGRPPHEAATLVLLHEGLGCVALWRDFPERLAPPPDVVSLCIRVRLWQI